ncbi:hypothetical protein, partial [Paenibacillus sp. FSL R7-0273]|uniref:hypothetical protein n=1 Tax=Paenibacillus sp. FSL R7-0273 TaxID=1536772 RepID=UPI00097AEAE8
PVKCPIPFILLLYLVYIFVGEDSNFFRGLWRKAPKPMLTHRNKGKNPFNRTQTHADAPNERGKSL